MPKLYYLFIAILHMHIDESKISDNDRKQLKLKREYRETAVVCKYELLLYDILEIKNTYKHCNFISFKVIVSNF